MNLVAAILITFAIVGLCLWFNPSPERDVSQRMSVAQHRAWVMRRRASFEPSWN